MRTERMTILLSPASKAAVSARAAAKGLSVGEYVRRKIEDEDDLSPGQEAELAALVNEVNAAVPKMTESLDDVIDTLRRTREKVERSLQQASTNP
jgi:folate-dependent tRNA-U54 methylase TrmFO/GidA